MRVIKRYIYLIRHGKTEYSGEKIYLGHTDCKLSEEGIDEVKQMTDIFIRNNIIIDSVFSSDLYRCKTTVKIIFPEKEAILLKELREINMGEWDGLTFQDVKKKYPEDFKRRGESIADFIPSNGESFRECQKRAVKAFYHIINTSKGNIAICSHAGFNRALLCHFMNMELQDIFSIKQDYGCINIITCNDLDVKVEGTNLHEFNT